MCEFTGKLGLLGKYKIFLKFTISRSSRDDDDGDDRNDRCGKMNKLDDKKKSKECSIK